MPIEDVKNVWERRWWMKRRKITGQVKSWKAFNFHWWFSLSNGFSLFLLLFLPSSLSSFILILSLLYLPSLSLLPDSQRHHVPCENTFLVPISLSHMRVCAMLMCIVHMIVVFFTFLIFFWFSMEIENQCHRKIRNKWL